MRIAVFGATSTIAKDFILSLAQKSNYELSLYARRPDVVKSWLLTKAQLDKYEVFDFNEFDSSKQFDAIINFVGTGNPAQGVIAGSSILDTTLKYDDLVLAYLRDHSECRYIFLSSGAAYGSNFDSPVTLESKAIIAVNNLKPHDWYAVAKLYAESRHRSLPHLAIYDVRVFNYVSCTQDMSARFLITDILRAIQSNTTLYTSLDYVVRDFMHPIDFCHLVIALLTSPATNTVVDCYSRAPIDKHTLLIEMGEKFGLKYETTQSTVTVNATGHKNFYYSLNTRAAEFGFKPSLTSLEGIFQETEKFLGTPSV